MRLYLTIKKEPFDNIKKGIKLEEYRNLTPYYDKKFSKKYTTVLLQNGYNPDSPRIELEVIDIVKGKKHYIIKLGKLL